ncbi:MAG: NAD(P)-binding domain-containing protein, partial [Bacteroidales bacterium]|nr:NAD(P)-binding domain-containing protein [Bacteroidales bacterium]
MSKKIVIIGAGMMGSALAFPARENGNEVCLVGTPLDRDIIEKSRLTGRHPKFERDFPAGVQYFQIEQWKEAVKGADFIIGGVSSFGVDWFLNEILSELDPSVPVLSVTKGLINLEDGTLISYPDYWKRELAAKGIKRHVSAIGGPCTSYELVYQDHSEVAFCGENTAELKMMKEAMKTSYYHISLTNDVIGLESAVALKNGYAL